MIIRAIFHWFPMVLPYGSRPFIWSYPALVISSSTTNVYLLLQLVIWILTVYSSSNPSLNYSLTLKATLPLPYSYSSYYPNPTLQSSSPRAWQLVHSDLCHLSKPTGLTSTKALPDLSQSYVFVYQWRSLEKVSCTLSRGDWRAFHEGVFTKM